MWWYSLQRLNGATSFFCIAEDGAIQTSLGEGSLIAEIKICSNMTSMEESCTSWLYDLEPEDCSLINELDTNVHRIADESYCSYATFNTENISTTMSNSSVQNDRSLERPTKLLKTCVLSSATTEQLSLQKHASFSSSCILSFNNVSPQPVKVEPKTKVGNHGKSLPSTGSVENQNNETGCVTQDSKKTGSVARSHRHGQDHIIAERMRREKISQQFIALAALIPGLKKMDKASVLLEGIKYVKELQKQVKLLEEQNKKESVESVVFVNKSQVSATDEDVSDTSSNSCDGSNLSSHDYPSKTNQSLPQVEARVSEKNVLIRIHCEKQKGVLMNILREIEKLHLTVVNSSALPIGTSLLDITIIAKMEDEFSPSVKELARKLMGLLTIYLEHGP